MDYLFDRIEDLPTLVVSVVDGYDAAKLIAEFFGLS
jgi:hypothetical protein